MRHLSAQGVGHLGPRALVVGEVAVAEGTALRVPGDGQVIRLLVPDQLEQHVGESEEGIGRQPLRVRHSADGIKGPKTPCWARRSDRASCASSSFMVVSVPVLPPEALSARGCQDAVIAICSESSPREPFASHCRLRRVRTDRHAGMPGTSGERPVLPGWVGGNSSFRTQKLQRNTPCT